jgi:molecular chaperone Hsp33
MMKQDSDSLYRFLFERTGVRGELVYLDASFRAVLERHLLPWPSPTPTRRGFGCGVIINCHIEIRGFAHSSGAGEGAAADTRYAGTHNRTVRGLARWSDEVPYGDLEQQFGDGHLVLTLDPLRGERYQGIVPLQGSSLRAALEAYFGASEQLPTRLWLAVDGQRAAGMMLQQMPGNTGDNNSQSPQQTGS